MAVLPLMVFLIDCVRQRSGGSLGQVCTDTVGHSVQMDNNLSSCQASSNQILPPLCHLDMGVVENLPPELFSELNEKYGGKLVDFIAKNKGKSENTSSSLCNSPYKPEGDLFLPGFYMNNMVIFISFYQFLMDALVLFFKVL